MPSRSASVSGSPSTSAVSRKVRRSSRGSCFRRASSAGEVFVDLVLASTAAPGSTPVRPRSSAIQLGELFVVRGVDPEDLTENDRRHGEAVGHVRLDRAGAGGRQPAGSVSGGRFEAGRPGGVKNGRSSCR